VRYNPARVRDPTFQDPKCIEPDFRESRDLFIHGIIDGPGGTCASMPVLYVAVGRRLGYPLKLVEAKGHLLFRWDDPFGKRFRIPETFNVEGTGNGIGSFSDEHYRKWPEAWNKAEIAAGCYLRSMSRIEELAGFLGTRAECLGDNGRIGDAVQAYRWAAGLVPNDERPRNSLARLIRKSQQAILELQEMIAFSQYSRSLGANQFGGAAAPASIGPAIAPHSGGCQCAACRQAERNAVPRGMAGHPSSCQCFHCQQTARARQQSTSAPGHSLGCMCALCQQHRNSPRAGNTSSGHW